MTDPYNRFESIQAGIRQRQLERSQRLEAIKEVQDDLDSVINFRVNHLLKEEFERICKEDQSTVSRILKRYMMQIVAEGRLK